MQIIRRGVAPGASAPRTGRMASSQGNASARPLARKNVRRVSGDRRIENEAGILEILWDFDLWLQPSGGRRHSIRKHNPSYNYRSGRRGQGMSFRSAASGGNQKESNRG